MDCPECGSDDTGVLETAPYSDRVRRRRECQACGHRFTTRENIVPDEAWTRKLDEHLDRAINGLEDATDALHQSTGFGGMMGLDEMIDELDDAARIVIRWRRRLERRRREA